MLDQIHPLLARSHIVADIFTVQVLEMDLLRK